MRKKFIMFVLFFTLLFMGSIFVIQNVKADSGWDSSYDSGGSSSYSSSYSNDYGSSHDYSSSSSGGSFANADPKAVFIGFTALLSYAAIMLFVVKLLLHKNEDKKKSEIYLPCQISQNNANLEIPGFNIEEFNFNVYKMFYNIQMAWMEFDYDKLKELVTDELYNTYVMDLEALKIKNWQNVMKGFKLNKVLLTGLKRLENGSCVAIVYIDVEFYDYVIKVGSNRVMRGNKNQKLNNIYKLTFIKKGNDTNNVNMCPSCGAPVEGNVTGICEYCKSKLVNDNFDWVMSKKEKIKQK